MKICVISTPVFRVPCVGYAGLEHLAWQHAAGLAAKGHEVSLIAPDGSECPGVTIIPIGPERSVSEKTAYSKYWPHLLEMDCIIDHSWSKHSLLLKMEERLKAPVLCVCHAPVNTMFREMPKLDKCCFVCISKDQGEHFKALFNRDVRVAHNGIDLDFYKSLGALRSGRFLFLARFSTIKGPDIALEACKKLGVGLDLIGDTSITNEPEYFQKCMTMANADSNAKIVGGVTRGETVWWYSRAHCLLHPNMRFREPLGLAPLESQAGGAPVIAFDNGAMRETLYHCENFENLVRTTDEFLEATRCAIHGITSKDREWCREWAAQFSVEKMISRYEELCKEAVETGGW